MSYRSPARLPALGAAAAAMLLASCAASPPNPSVAAQPPQPVAAAAPPPEAFRPREPAVAPLTLEGYKKEIAQHVAHSSPALFHEPLPKVLKSIVIVDVTIGHDGRLSHVAIQRSNGFKHLELVAMNSVRQAAPFPAPERRIQRRDGSVNFLETFLFRDDGRFQIRSLVTEPQ